MLGDLGAKLDRDFVDQVALSVLRVINDIHPTEMKISSLIAVAQLGRVSGMGSGDDLSITNRPILIDDDSIRSLSTHTLVKLHWALGRLPAYTASKEVIEMMRNEIQSKLPSALGVGDCMVYLRTLADSYIGQYHSLNIYSTNLHSSRKFIHTLLL